MIRISESESVSQLNRRKWPPSFVQMPWNLITLWDLIKIKEERLQKKIMQKMKNKHWLSFSDRRGSQFDNGQPPIADIDINIDIDIDLGVDIGHFSKATSTCSRNSTEPGLAFLTWVS